MEQSLRSSPHPLITLLAALALGGVSLPVCAVDLDPAVIGRAAG